MLATRCGIDAADEFVAIMGDEVAPIGPAS
jgi:hypothetical protein